MHKHYLLLTTNLADFVDRIAPQKSAHSFMAAAAVYK